MSNVKRVYVEKKPAFAVQAHELKSEISGYLGIRTVTDVRVLIRYDVENLPEEVFEKACRTVFAEPPVDILYRESFEIPVSPEKGIHALYFSFCGEGQLDLKSFGFINQ